MRYIKEKKLTKLLCQPEKSSLQTGILPGFQLLSTSLMHMSIGYLEPLVYLLFIYFSKLLFCFRTWAINCTVINNAIVKQIKTWSTDDNCKDGGEKCLYTVCLQLQCKDISRGP